MAEFDFTQAIGEARAKYESIAKALDVDRLKADIKDLETQAAAPGLWDDPENAQKITSRLSAAESQLKRLNSASQRIDDVENGKSYVIAKDGKPGPVCTKLYNKLRAIQYGDEPDTHGWVTVVE
jgi:hypothetical protein